MGIFQRENGYYYLRLSTPSGEKRLSLETKDKAFAKDIYQAYLLDKIRDKVNRGTAHSGVHACAVSSPSVARSSFPALTPIPADGGCNPSPPHGGASQKSKQPLITLCFAQYLQSCQAQKLTLHVIQAKQRLLKFLY